jgi:hypothetical protein
MKTPPKLEGQKLTLVKKKRNRTAKKKGEDEEH